MRSTHTYAILEVDAAAYADIKARLEEAGYHHAIHGGVREDCDVLDMHGIALAVEPQAADLLATVGKLPEGTMPEMGLVMLTAADLEAEKVKRMVDRFLSWKLPEDFRPDGGIEFDADAAKKLNPVNRRYEPYGTNLLDATQAEALIRHLLAGEK